MEPQVKKQHYFQKKPENILEIGKGNDTVSDYLKKIGFSVTICDLEK